MTKFSDKKLADAQNITEDVLPYYDELLADIWALGSFPDKIVEMLKPLNLPPNESRILDLGCGKGAAAISVAKKLNLKVDGYDIFKPFLDFAIKKAESENISNLCNFFLADINEIIHNAADYDVVIYASAGPVFKDLKECVQQLRQTVHKGGYILINESYAIEDEKVDLDGYDYLKGYDGIVTHEKSKQQLTFYGDRLLNELVVPKSEVAATNQHNNDVIRKRAEKLAKQWPEKAHIFHDFVRKEKDECKIIENVLEDVLWLLEKI